MELTCVINGKTYLRMERLFYLTLRFMKNKAKVEDEFDKIGAFGRRIVKYVTTWFGMEYIIIEYLVPTDKIKEFNEINVREIIRRKK